VAGRGTGWYARNVDSTTGIGGGGAGPWYRVQAITAAGSGGTAERDYASVLPAALNAALQRRPFVAGWLSRGGGAPLELISNAGPLPTARAHGRHDAPDDEPDGPEELLFPWGARGVRVPAGLLADLDCLIWAPCPGRQALPFAGDSGDNGPRPAGRQPGARPGGSGQGSRGHDGGQQATLFESALTTLITRPFGWLVVAEPTGALDAETAELRTQLNVLRRYDEEHARFDADRAQRRLAELDAFREAGLWNVRVLAGAASEQELRLIAPVLVGSVDLGAHPYRLRSAEGARDLADALVAKHIDASDGAEVPFAATAGTLVALTGLPRLEVPGVRVLQPGYFDLTSETSDQHAIELGAILDVADRPVGVFRVPLDTLNRHAFVTGATGAGKSQTVRHTLEQLTRAGIPWLAIEPVKSEYAAMAGRIAGIGEVTVINPADPAAVPISVNPLAPEPGYPVQAHIDMVRALFLAAFDAHEPFPQIISQALQRAYEACGWDPVTGGGRPGAPAGPAVPTLARLQRAALEVIEDVGYGRELQADVRGFVDVRLRSLRVGSAGRFFEGGHPADIGELLRRNVVLAIEDVANDEDKAFLIGTLIIRIVEHLRLRARAGGDDGLRHVIVIEEAHRLLRAQREGASGHAVELFASMLAEIRAYGEGIIVAEQIPAKLVPDVVKNTALKVLHRLPAQDDRQVVGAAMNLDDDQSRQVVSLRPGDAAVFADGMDRPLRIRVPFGGDRERAPVARDPAAGPAGQAGAASGAGQAGAASGAGQAGAASGAGQAGAASGLAGPAALVLGRRSAACGPTCASGRPCTLLELRAADLLAGAADDAWLRIWTEALALAFLTSRPLPVAPASLRQRWSGLGWRLRECLLATAIERVLHGRVLTIRAYYEPGHLAAAMAGTALRLLDGGSGAGTRPGTSWVIPQLQWLHEVERVCPLGDRPPDPFGVAPPLEFPLAGLADRPGLRIGQRVSGLRRHPLSMELARNRLPAWTALLGEDDQRGFTDDLASVVIGVSHRGQLRKAAGEMGVAGWLETVLSWPRRFIVGFQDEPTASAGFEREPAAR
jgi:DNA helicase HerA-like ATPase